MTTYVAEIAARLYTGLVIVNDPVGCRLPDAFNSSTTRLSVPSTTPDAGLVPAGNPEITSGST